jgi:hypothetical protein
MPGYKTGLMPVISVIGIDLLAFHKWLDFNVDLIYLCYENLKKSQSRRRLSMKKLIAVTLLLLVAGNAYALTDLALGVYGGLNAPLAQQDTKSGAGFGAKVKIAPTPLLGAAAFFETRSFGEPEVTIFEGDPHLQQTLKTDGGKVTVFGVEGMIGATGGGIGPHFYWMVGIASYKWKRDNYDDLSKVGYHLGPGLEFGLPSGIGIEAKAKLELVPTDGDGSRKNLLIFVGANYHFGIM